MQSRLAPHLERIAGSLEEVESYPFPESRIFTNSLLKSYDIVSFIRDTDAHERALFLPITPQSDSRSHTAMAESTVPHRSPTVYSVLGGDMVGRIRKGLAGSSGDGDDRGDVPDVDVDLLLLGAEKLTSVYQIPRASSRITRSRERYEELSESIANYGALVASQRMQLNLLNRLDADATLEDITESDEALDVTDTMIEEQEALIRDLEERKDILEYKVKNIDQKMSALYRNIS